ncbi:putative phosphonate metabolism protein [Roseovarius sp. MBR-51]
MDFHRYAVYVTPPEGEFAALGAAWLGWDAAQGCTVAHPEVPGLPAPVAEITETPRKYGLHATIKPPFALAEGQREASLIAAFERFCAGEAAVTLEGLEIAALGRFLALVPVGDQGALSGLAARAVAAFEPWRAPLSEAQVARRRAGGLSPAQDALLLRWGYPYVMEEFRFHITLTGKRPKGELPGIKAALEGLIGGHLPRPYVIDALSLMGEDGAGRFHLIHRQTLTA